MDTDQETMVTRLWIKQEMAEIFSEWQKKFHLVISAFPGFVSLEISSPSPTEWILSQRFASIDALNAWKTSVQKRMTMNELRPCFTEDRPQSILEEEDHNYASSRRATEIFVTHVHPDQLRPYREWIGKIHQAETKFPGFQRAYVQAPHDAAGGWISMIQFETAEHLDAWLNSKERQTLLNEGNSMIRSLESHRVASSFAGWFSPSRTGLESIPPVWKQTMLVLLVLFPIVMLEIKFLSPLTAKLNPSLGTFIGNAISVSLVSWPLMPLVIRCLGWWLNPKDAASHRISALGVVLVGILYLLEIAFFWDLL